MNVALYIYIFLSLYMSLKKKLFKLTNDKQTHPVPVGVSAAVVVQNFATLDDAAGFKHRWFL